MIKLYNSMNKKDIIFAAICGFFVAFIALDLLTKFAGRYSWAFFIILPVLSVFGLWVAELIATLRLRSGQESLSFVRQIAKFSLAGGLADVFDIKTFQLLFWLAPLSAELSLIYKTISFLVGTFVKYFSDKYWTFQKSESKGMHKEMAKFFFIAIVGSLLNITSYYFFVKINTSLPLKTWQEIANILAALTAATWNFCGYKFIVFKK